MKYAHHYQIIQQDTQGLISSKDGAQILGKSIRQFKRLKEKVKKLGPKALIHGNCGRIPHNVYSKEIQKQVIIYRKSFLQSFYPQRNYSSIFSSLL